MTAIAITDAVRIFGADCLGAGELATAFSSDPLASLAADERAMALSVPFDRDVLMRAADEGMMLVLRVPRDSAGTVLTVAALAERFPGRDSSAGNAEAPWFAREAFAVDETCRLGWALVDKQPPRATTNLSYLEQEEELVRRSDRLGFALRRRTAVEIVYDTLVYAAARGERLLESRWDWSSTMTTDGGAVTAGQFDDRGLRLLAYSKGVRFDTLGVCATLQRET